MKRRALVTGLGCAALWCAGARAEPLPAVRLPGMEGLVSPPPDAWDFQTDVLVIGGGAAGLSAALAAAESGAQVILAEKQPECGGDTLVAGGYFNAVLPEDRARGDSPEFFERQMLESSRGLADPEVVRALAQGATGSFLWLKQLGVHFLPEPQLVFGSLFPRTRKSLEPRGQGYVRALLTACLRRKIPVWTSSPATALVQGAGGRVLGAALSQRNGPVTVRARRGVVIACGGYGANPDLIRAVSPGMGGLRTDSRPGATGEMLLAAGQAGAQLVNLSRIECTPGSDSSDDTFVRLDLRPARMIMVNSAGKRFADERAGRSELAQAILAQSPSRVWTVADSDTVSSFDVTIRKNLLRGAYSGEVLREMTLKGLAARMGVDVPAFLKTAFAMAESRHLKTPPFWAVPVALRIHVTLGGIRIDREARAVDAAGRPVPGLWAAGAAAGNVHGANRLGGNGINTAVTFGRIAGQSAAKA